MAFSFKGVFLFSEEAQSYKLREKSIVTSSFLLLFRVSYYHLRRVLEVNKYNFPSCTIIVTSGEIQTIYKYSLFYPRKKPKIHIIHLSTWPGDAGVEVL